ncbi:MULTISPECIES: MarR family winged helix-turn-helix transcriptional regulator [Bacillaceae]|jgi:MarR family transcriptional regulator, teicoplanin-associated locus regulator|uniref:MarR family winged helix-turn-helix transcriptional regulator n=1 Tax=Bacillaceae TaxID=186817 RepID=UPI0006AE4E76|nr:MULTISPECIES: MarR family winged helix-turn-helix transcriptional regulator [Bacillaceae]ALC87190.1 MarR family transcriptional regulator [Bacillus sp. FJAT-22090]KQL34698.1 MarR family transcriptional regulator [Psychrobacillus sp. FJAT-21963]
MNKNNLFHKFVAFTTSVHRVTHELTKNAKLDTITPVQYNILEYVYVSQPVTPSEISDCQYMSMPNTSRELKKLSEKNLIDKFGDIEDRRKQYIRLSKEGETMMNSAFQLIESDFLKRIKDASKEDLEEIEKALDILHKKVFY